MRVLPPAVALLAVGTMAAAAGSPWRQVSLNSAGGQATGGSFDGSVTPNGRFVAFDSYSPDLLAAPGGTEIDVFVRDMKAGITSLVSRNLTGGEGNGDSEYPCLSANGRWVVFQSKASDLVAGDTAAADVFVADRRSGDLARISEGFDGSPPDGLSQVYGPSISANGRWACFMSYATNIVEGANTLSHRQVYLRDLRRGITTLASRDASVPLVGADTGGCSDPTISPNGRFLVFTSNAANLLAASSNGAYQVFVEDLRTGALRVASADADGNLGNGNCHSPVVSNNGRWVAFWTEASNLSPGDTPGRSDTVLKDMTTGEVRTLSSSADSNDSYEAALSASGRTVVFSSDKSDLVPADGNGTGDVFAFDPRTETVRRLSVNAAGVEGDRYSFAFSTALSSNGKWLVVDSESNNLVEGFTDPSNAVDILLLRLK